MKNLKKNKKLCPIFIMLEEANLPINSNILTKLIPFLKQNNFQTLALEEMEDRSLELLINIYGALTVKEILEKDAIKKNTNMYHLLKKAKENAVKITNIDYDKDRYLKANMEYEVMRNKWSREIEKVLNEQIAPTIQKKLNSKDNKVLTQDIASSFFTNNPIKFGHKALMEHSSENYYEDPKVITFVQNLLNHNFNSERSDYFAKKIDNICLESKSGVIALLTNYHGKVSKILKDQGYIVKTYYIKNYYQDLDFVTKFLDYNYEAANNIMFHNLTKIFESYTSQESIINYIQKDIENSFAEITGQIDSGVYL